MMLTTQSIIDVLILHKPTQNNKLTPTVHVVRCACNDTSDTTDQFVVPVKVVNKI